MSDSGEKSKEENPGGGGTAATEPPTEKSVSADKDGPPPPSGTGEPAAKSGVDEAKPPASSDGVTKVPGSDTGAGESSKAPSPDAGGGEPADADLATSASNTSMTASKTGSRTQAGGKSGSRLKLQKRVKGEVIDMNNARIGFLGAGKMTEALVRGLLEVGKLDPARFFIAAKTDRNLEMFKERGCTTNKRAYNVFASYDCDVVFLNFHGKVIRELYRGGGSRPMALTTNYIPNQRHMLYLMSMVGGVGLNDIKQVLLHPDKADKYKLEAHRFMVNASVAYGIGLAALDCDKDVTKKCSPLVRALLTSVATSVEQFDENQMDVACAVGGNGLAFCYFFLTAMTEGAFKMGLQKTVACKMAAKTLLSAAESLIESGKHPSELRDQCTSPSGPAIYGVHMLDKQDCNSGLAAAIEGAFKRIKELSEA